MNIVQQYEHDAKVEMKEAIKNNTTLLSQYVLKREEDERNHVNDLRIVSYETNKKNPFHGIQQSSKDKTTIRIFNKPGDPSTVGLGIKYELYEGVHTLLVGAIDVTSMFAQTSLRIGMRIFEVNGNFLSGDENHDQELFTFKNGRPWGAQTPALGCQDPSPGVPRPQPWGAQTPALEDADLGEI